jgi:hypothetical protein
MATNTMSAPMTVKQIASRLVELCRQGNYEQAQQELFSNDAESIEPEKAKAGGWDTHVKGMDKIKEKAGRWQQMVEAFHGGSVTDPIIAGNFIAVGMMMDVTIKGMPRNKMEEICLYEVKDGKIVREEFFF